MPASIWSSSSCSPWSASGDQGRARVRAAGRLPARAAWSARAARASSSSFPGIERAQRVDLRTITMDIPPQDVITKDNVSVKVNAVLYFRVIDPNRASSRSRTTSSPPRRTRRRRCAASAARPSSTSCWPSARRSTRSCRASSTSTPSRGASRWCRSRSSTSTCRRRCGARWRVRRRPSASGAPR